MTSEEHLEEALEGRFIKRVLKETATDIDLAQVKYMDSHGFSNPDWKSARNFTVTESALDYTQKLKHRFVDMKRISRNMKPFKKKPHPIYNKIIWGHYNNIIRDLQFGFTEAVKAELRTLEE